MAGQSKTAARLVEKGSCRLWLLAQLYLLLRLAALVIFWPVTQLFLKVLKQLLKENYKLFSHSSIEITTMRRPPAKRK